MKKDELERIKLNFEKIKDKFELIDEQIDKSMKVSSKCWKWQVDL